VGQEPEAELADRWRRVRDDLVEHAGERDQHEQARAEAKATQDQVAAAALERGRRARTRAGAYRGQQGHRAAI